MKNSQEKINIILEDLYQIDASFKNYEKDLRQLIKSLLELRPEAELDEKFRQELKTKILNRIEELKAAKQIKETSFMTKLTSIKLPAYVALGVSVIFLAVLVGTAYYKGQLLPFRADKVSTTEGVSINTLSNNRAFGSLEGSNSQPPTHQGETAKMEAPQDLGAGSSNLDSQPTEVRIAPYKPVNYEYVYDGELNLEGDYIEVLQRLVNNNSNSFKGIINQFNLGLMDFSKLSNVVLKTIHLEEDNDYGYSISINLDQGIMSIYKNWRNWSTIKENKTVTNETFAQPKPTIRPQDIPSDDALIKIAERFLKKYKIDLTPYGEPEVYQGREFLIQREAETDRAIPAFSNIRIVYPLLIGGEKVYTTSGEAFGLNISIDIAKEKVSGLHNLTVQQYNESNYKMASEKEVLDYLKAGGNQGQFYYRDDQSEKVTVNLKKPEIGYVKYWQPSDKRQERPKEILVPALIFAVQEKPTDVSYNFQDKIVVPLAQELIQRMNHRPIPVPMIDTTE